MAKPFATLPLVFAVLAGAVGIYWYQHEARKAESPSTAATAETGLSRALATGALAGFLIREPRQEIAAFAFADAAGIAKDLAAFRGKVVLLNLWATWCLPCRKEMPDLAKLQQQLGGPDFEVVALSLDRKGQAASAAFLKEVGAESLAIYTDVESKSLAALQALGLPATILIDRNGKEAGRLLGPADWASPEAVALIQAAIAEK